MADASEDVRKAALTAFAELVETADAAAIETVAARLEDRHPDVRRAAVKLLAHFVDRGYANAVAIEQVAMRLEHADRAVKYWAVAYFAEVVEKGDATAIAAIAPRL